MSIQPRDHLSFSISQAWVNRCEKQGKRIGVGKRIFLLAPMRLVDAGFIHLPLAIFKTMVTGWVATPVAAYKNRKGKGLTARQWSWIQVPRHLKRIGKLTFFVFGKPVATNRRDAPPTPKRPQNETETPPTITETPPPAAESALPPETPNAPPPPPPPSGPPTPPPPPPSGPPTPPAQQNSPRGALLESIRTGIALRPTPPPSGPPTTPPSGPPAPPVKQNSPQGPSRQTNSPPSFVNADLLKKLEERRQKIEGKGSHEQKNDGTDETWDTSDQQYQAPTQGQNNTVAQPNSPPPNTKPWKHSFVDGKNQYPIPNPETIKNFDEIIDILKDIRDQCWTSIPERTIGTPINVTVDNNYVWTLTTGDVKEYQIGSYISETYQKTLEAKLKTALTNLRDGSMNNPEKVKFLTQTYPTVLHMLAEMNKTLDYPDQQNLDSSKQFRRLEIVSDSEIKNELKSLLQSCWNTDFQNEKKCSYSPIEDSTSPIYLTTQVLPLNGNEEFTAVKGKIASLLRAKQAELLTSSSGSVSARTAMFGGGIVRNNPTQNSFSSIAKKEEILKNFIPQVIRTYTHYANKAPKTL